MKLTEQNVKEIARKVSPEDIASRPGRITQEGVFVPFGFDPKELENQRENIKSMLTQLPEGLNTKEGLVIPRFHEAKDGEIVGEYWTLEPAFIEVLVAFARALKLIEPTAPRSEWTGDNMAHFRYVS